MAAKAKVDRKEFADLWDKGVKVAQIAETFGIAQPTVSTLARRYRLRLRNPHNKRTVSAVPAEEQQPEAPEESSPLDPRPDFPEARDLALIDSGGEYTRIADLAAEWGLPMRNVMARWHRLRAAQKTTKKPTVRKVTT